MLQWNVYNSSILIGAFCMLLLVLCRLMRSKKATKTAKYFYWFLIITAVAIIQYISFDIGFLRKHPAIYLFFFPFEFLAPVLFTAFTCAYLQKETLFKKYQYYLLIPFIAFFLLYTVIKINGFFELSWFSKETLSYIRTEINENIALGFTFLLGIWNYKIIKDYERGLGAMPYDFVMYKTKWLKNIYLTLILLSVFWLAILVYIKIDENVGGNDTYYPLWIAYIICYFVFYYLSLNHLSKTRITDGKITPKTFNLSGLNQIFNEKELALLESNQSQVTSILSYFATSLFDKHKLQDVLWDIVENCISKLDLEDCVIYMVNEEAQELIQEAAYGNKQEAAKKILSPKQIPIGEGIVGNVAKTGKFEWIRDTSKDARYILDDKKRNSELAVPILVDKKVIGVLDSEHSEKDFFTEQHVQLFQLIAKLTAKKVIQITQKKGLSITNDNAYFKEVCYLMEKEKIYRNPEMKLSTISKEINISSNYLSQLINKLSGQNFSDFINGYRIMEAKNKLIHPAFTSYPVLSIGLESGFNSKSAFYNSFKKHTGMSPTEYREKHPFAS